MDAKTPGPCQSQIKVKNKTHKEDEKVEGTTPTRWKELSVSIMVVVYFYFLLFFFLQRFKYIYWTADFLLTAGGNNNNNNDDDDNNNKDKTDSNHLDGRNLQQNHVKSAMLLPSCAFVVRNVHLCQSLPRVGAQIIPVALALTPDQRAAGCS